MRNVPPSAVAVIVVNRSAIERWCEPQNLVRQDPHDTRSSCRLSAKQRQSPTQSSHSQWALDQHPKNPPEPSVRTVDPVRQTYTQKSGGG